MLSGRSSVFAALVACLLLASTSPAIALTTAIVSSQDASYRNCDGVISTSVDRTLSVFGSGCINALMRFDLGVIGSAGLARAQSLTLELPIAGSVSGMNLQAEYSFVPSALSWDEKSSEAALSSALDGLTVLSESVALIGQNLAQITIPLPADLVSNSVLEVRLATDSSSAAGVDSALIVSVGSRRQSLSNLRSRVSVVMQEECVESTDISGICLSSSAFGYSGENAGFCIGGATGFCDCHSGMFGANCGLNSTLINPQCNYASFGVPQNLITNFPPLIARDSNGIKSNRYENNRLILNIESPLVQRRSRTELILGNSASPNFPGQNGCRYPGYFWDKEIRSGDAFFTPANSNLTCVESYTAAIPWGTALQCGWAVDNNIKPGFTTYRSVITVQHTEHLSALRGSSVERSLQHLIPIQVVFPKTVTVSTNVSVFSFVNLQAAIVAQKVLLPSQTGVTVDNPTGRLVLATSLQWPFTLSAVQFEDLATGQRFNFQLDNPHPTSEGTFVEDCLANAAAGNANPICNQLFGLDMLPFPNTCDLNGNYKYTFSVACRGPANLCPLGDANDPARTATVQVQLKSEDFCAQIEIDIDAKGTLRVFDDNTYTNPKSAFLFEDAQPQRAFFRADVSSDKATIQKAWIESVSVYPSNNAQARTNLYTQAGGALSPLINFITADGVDSAFFDVDVVPLSFPGVDVDANVQFSVEAVVGIEFEQPTFAGAKKRSISYKTYTFERRAVGAAEPDLKQQTAAAVATIGLALPKPAPVSDSTVQAPVAAGGGGATGSVQQSSASGVVASGMVAVLSALAGLLFLAF